MEKMDCPVPWVPKDLLDWVVKTDFRVHLGLKVLPVFRAKTVWPVSLEKTAHRECRVVMERRE